MRMSVIRQETWLSRLDLSRLAARANTAAEKPADSSRSLIVTRIDSSSSTIATSGPLGTSISRWDVEEQTSARRPARQLPERGANLHLQTFQARKVCRRYDFGIDRLRRCGRLAQPVRHSHELGKRSRVHLPHDLPAVNLHRHLAQAQVRCNLLVGPSDDNKRHDLPLALGKSSEALAQLGKANRLAASFPVTLDRRVNCIEHILIVKRLAEELDGARLHRPHAHRDVPVARDEKHGQRQALFREL